MYTYTIQRGDTLSKIAQRYGTTTGALAELNHLPDPDLIHAGQVILVPGPGANGATAGSGGVESGAAIATHQHYTVVPDEGLKVRAEPSPTAAERGVLPRGAAVLASGNPPRSGGDYTWLEINAESSQLSGWVAMQYLVPSGTPTDQHPHRWPDVLSVAQLYDLVRFHGAEPFLDSIMVASALTESHGNRHANGDGGRSRGLWQMHDQGLGSGMSVEQRCDPDAACARMLPEFRRVYAAQARQGLTGDDLAVTTYLKTERPFDFDAAGKIFLGWWRKL